MSISYNVHAQRLLTNTKPLFKSVIIPPTFCNIKSKVRKALRHCVLCVRVTRKRFCTNQFLVDKVIQNNLTHQLWRPILSLSFHFSSSVIFKCGKLLPFITMALFYFLDSFCVPESLGFTTLLTFIWKFQVGIARSFCPGQFKRSYRVI